ncbi:hypothetical protein PV327_011060 [Microctonus hyperodae]|uniref:Uncharacterized protein n=1 Tax=Microctonus hyperodae TaxID=165561 RepID=A0AA39C851_MICHY|nr:hypothetical protein PV327_011060 [Microctonus hyperodae]
MPRKAFNQLGKKQQAARINNAMVRARGLNDDNNAHNVENDVNDVRGNLENEENYGEPAPANLMIKTIGTYSEYCKAMKIAWWGDSDYSEHFQTFEMSTS